LIDQQFLIVTQEEILKERTYQLEAKHRNFINNYQSKDEQVKGIKTRSFLKYLRYQALVGREYVAQLNRVQKVDFDLHIQSAQLNEGLFAVALE
jgi:vacuolar-type H+-ATPase subunit D/Vma8